MLMVFYAWPRGANEGECVIDIGLLGSPACNDLNGIFTCGFQFCDDMSCIVTVSVMARHMLIGNAVLVVVQKTVTRPRKVV